MVNQIPMKQFLMGWFLIKQIFVMGIWTPVGHVVSNPTMLRNGNALRAMREGGSSKGNLEA
jgi:hypothetical protein